MIKIKHPNFEDREIEIQYVESEVIVNAIVTATDGKKYRIPLDGFECDKEKTDLFASDKVKDFSVNS